MGFWNSLVGSIESITLVVSIIATILGGVALIHVIFFWNRVQRHYRETVAKATVSLFRLLLVLAGLFSKFATSQHGGLLDQPWVLTISIAAFGYCLWELVGVIGDSKQKNSKNETIAECQGKLEEAQGDREDAEFQALQLTWLLSYLRRIAHEKLQRVRSVVKSNLGTKSSIPQAREALNPDEQVGIILEQIVSLFHVETIADSSKTRQNFRVGLFIETDGHLVPADAFDLATLRNDPFTSYEKHEDRYRLDNTTNPSHAVRCVLEGRTLIVADCASEPGFDFFSEQQKVYLRSMVAHPVADFRLDGVNPIRAALLIDTDVASFFEEEDRKMLELRINEFVVRINLEYAIKALIGRSKALEGSPNE